MVNWRISDCKQWPISQIATNNGPNVDKPPLTLVLLGFTESARVLTSNMKVYVYESQIIVFWLVNTVMNCNTHYHYYQTIILNCNHSETIDLSLANRCLLP